jgi:hypothetical protein
VSGRTTFIGFRRTCIAAMALLVTTPSLAAECSLDQVIFKDRKSGRQFTAERVALNQQYLCGRKLVSADAPRRKLKDCRGPYGDTIIEGYMNGERVYAIYTVNAASPCCSWESYAGTNTHIPKQVKKWLPTGRAPKITLGDEWYTIEASPGLPMEVGGPLGGGAYVPILCRG